MTEMLRAWTISLSGIIVFGSLCEMILPNGAYKKYIQLAIGLMLCLAVLSPITNGTPDFDTDILSADVYASSEEIDDVENSDIIPLYKKKLCEKIEQDITEHTDADINVKCEVSEEEQDFGCIKHLRIIADAKDIGKIGNEIVEIVAEKYGVANENIKVMYLK